jgi:hypothetical protein
VFSSSSRFLFPSLLVPRVLVPLFSHLERTLERF